MKKLTLPALAVLALTVVMTPGSARAADLTIEVTGLAKAEGEVLVSLFDQAEGWLKKGVAVGKATAKAGSVTVTFKDLKEGSYAASVVHDVNGNKKLDTNAIGMPVEPYGFSNDAAGNFGPPPFEKARFELPAAGRSIAVKVS